MNQIKLRNKRLKALNRKYGSTLKPLEIISMRLHGYMDARRDLPVSTDDGSWDSPRIQIEVRKYIESASKLWAGLQIEHEARAAELKEKKSSVNAYHNRVENARADWMAMKQTASSTIRLKGEDRLTDAQVMSRRAAEANRANAPLRDRINRLESEYASILADISRIQAELVEDINTTSMLSNRLKEHCIARLTVYWDSAYKKHPVKAKLPVAVSVTAIDKAAADYARIRKDLLVAAEQLSKEDLTNE